MSADPGLADIREVTELRAGNPEALATLMERYGEGLLRFAFSLVGSRDAAEDVVQSVFVRLWERRETLDPASRLKSYLFAAVRNRALGERSYETVRAKYRASIQRDAESNANVTPSHEDAILRRATIYWAVEQLSERRRLAVRLRLEEQMTHAEIAEVLGVTEVAAKRLVARAIEDLREILWGE